MIITKMGLVLMVLIGFAIFSLLNLSFATSDENEKDQVEEKIILGPLLLGDLFERSPDRLFWEKYIVQANDISIKEIVRELNKCRVYVVDHKRFSKADKKWYFSQLRPSVVAEGRFSFALNNKKKRTIKIHLEELKLSSVKTVRSYFPNEKPSRDAYITIRVLTPYLKSASKARPNEFVFGESYNIASPFYVWTIQGQKLGLKKK